MREREGGGQIEAERGGECKGFKIDHNAACCMCIANCTHPRKM
jgi:hypothetical protein